MRKFFILSLTLLAGCMLGPDYKKPALDLPKNQPQDGAEIFARPKWWEMFNDNVLNSLVEEGVQNNKDLAAALARVEEAKAQVKITNSALFPSLDFGAQAYYGTVVINNENVTSPVQEYTAAPALSYELDLWGKNRRLSEAAKAEYFSTRAAKDLTYLVLTASVVKTYFLILTLDAQIEIADDTVTADEETVKIYVERYSAGTVSNLDLQRVTADMESVRAAQINLWQQLSEAQTSLAVLLGRTPREIVERQIERGGTLDAQNLAPDVPAGIPSDILQKRPDVAEAEQQLIAANARIGAAKADYFPNISLTGQAGYISGSLTDFVNGSNGIWNIAAGLAQPLFEGGKIRAENKAAKAAYDEALANYEHTVQNAFKDVYDAVNANSYSREIYEAALKQQNAMQTSYDISNDQFAAGLIDTINLLDVKRNLLSARLSLVNARYNELASAVNLSQALGGGWGEYK
ncbi:MAG: efflux transporter outer membrane subunit [Elusimicrobia bacterium]|nr:efflux transporter outer membrane subunit [Elusimicrobiota bacterium]